MALELCSVRAQLNEVVFCWNPKDVYQEERDLFWVTIMLKKELNKLIYPHSPPLLYWMGNKKEVSKGQLLRDWNLISRHYSLTIGEWIIDLLGCNLWLECWLKEIKSQAQPSWRIWINIHHTTEKKAYNKSETRKQEGGLILEKWGGQKGQQNGTKWCLKIAATWRKRRSYRFDLCNKPCHYYYFS